MSEFISRLAGIMLLRNGPQDMPSGTLPLLLAVTLYAAATGLSVSIGDGLENPLAVMLLAIALPLVLARIVLGLRGRLARWKQTVTALFGTSGLISLLSLPLTASVAGGDQASALPAIAGLVLFLWSFAIDAHIWRHALDTFFAAGLAVAVLLFAISIYVITFIAGPL